MSDKEHLEDISTGNINEEQKDNIGDTMERDKNPIDNREDVLGFDSPNNPQKDMINPEKVIGDNNANIDNDTTEITHSTSVIPYTRSIDNGSDSQDEELKLRWDDDDDHIPMVYEASNTVVDETEMDLESKKTNPIDLMNCESDEDVLKQIQVKNEFLDLKIKKSVEETKIKTNITMQLTDKCDTENNETDVAMPVTEQQDLNKVSTADRKDENIEANINLLDNISIPSLEFVSDSPRSFSCIAMDIDSCKNEDVYNSNQQELEIDNAENSDNKVHNKSTLTNIAQPDIGSIKSSTKINIDLLNRIDTALTVEHNTEDKNKNIDENIQTQKDMNNMEFGLDEKVTAISPPTIHSTDDIKLSNIPLTTLDSKSETNFDLKQPKCTETRDNKYNAIVDEAVDNLKFTSENITSTQETSEDTTIEVKTDHGLNQPDFMLDIPSQELIDIDDISLNSEISDDIDKEILLNDDNIDKEILLNDDDINKTNPEKCKTDNENTKQFNFILTSKEDFDEDSKKVNQHLCEIVTENIQPKSIETTKNITGLEISVTDSIDSKYLKTEPALIAKQPSLCKKDDLDKEVLINYIQTSNLQETITNPSDISDEVPKQIIEGNIPSSTKSLVTAIDCKTSILTKSDEMVYSKSDTMSDVKDRTKIDTNIVVTAKLEDNDSYSTSMKESKLTPANTEEPLEVNNSGINNLLTSTIDLKPILQTVASSGTNVISEVTNKLPIKTTNAQVTEMDIQGSTSVEDVKVTQGTLNEVNKQIDNPDISAVINIYPSTSSEAVKVSSAITEELTPLKKINNTNLQATDIIVKPTTIESIKISEDPPMNATKIDNSTENTTLLTKEDVRPSTSTKDVEITLSTPTEVTALKHSAIGMDVQPSTSSKVVEVTPITSKVVTAVKQLDIEMDALPSTSSDAPKMTPDTSDEVPEMTDSLGLLAESSRVMEDDEEPDDPEEDDDDDEFDPDDESSNQMTADHSEDSNAQHSETDLPKEQEEKEAAFPTVEGKEDRSFQFEIGNVVTETTEDVETLNKDEDVVMDEIECEEMDVPENAAVAENSEQGVDKIDIEKTDVPKQAEEPSRTSDIETVKLSDASDNEVEGDTSPKMADNSCLRALLTDTKGKSKQAPSKTKKLEITQPRNIVNIVDLEESSSEEDQEDQKNKSEKKQETTQVQLDDDVTSVNIPKDIEIMCTSGGSTSEIVTKKDEVVISGVPKPPPQKPARLNTSEVTIKTTSVSSESTLVIPETKISNTSPPKMGLEIFSLDSDEDEDVSMKETTVSENNLTALEGQTAQESNKCINYACKSGKGVQYYIADAATKAYYDVARKRKAMVCESCAEVVANRTQSLVDGIKDLTPLLDLDLIKISQELVEISDSDTESEADTNEEPKVTIGQEGAKFLEENLAELINETWRKFNVGSRLHEAHSLLDAEIDKMQVESNEIHDLLNECQVATDKLRNELYATFEPERKELPSILIFDTPNYVYSCRETDGSQPVTEHELQLPHCKRRSSTSNAGAPAKRPAIPMGYTPLDPDPASNQDHTLQDEKREPLGLDGSKLDDDKDVSVVHLSAEAAPADLPPAGDATLPPLRVGMAVYAMRNAFGSWLRGKVLECQPKGSTQASINFTMCRVKFEHKLKNSCKILPARCLAYAEPPEVRLTIGTRVIALFKDSTNGTKRESYYSGIVAEIPNPVNNYRYLVFFDDGYAQYVSHAYTRLVCEYSSLVWEEVHPFSREFVRQYLLAYPERPMVRLHAGQSLKTEWNGKWWVSKVTKVDASLVQVHFEEDDRTEWIYRGSTRLAPLYLELQAAERHRARPLPRTKGQSRTNMPYVEYTRTDEEGNNKSAEPTQQQQEEIRRQRAVAKKSTVTPQYQPTPPPLIALDTVTSRVVYYTPKNAVRPLLLVPHVCSPKCKRSDVLALKDLRTYNPLAKPLLSGWERQIVRHKGQKEVMYRAPCGRRLRNMPELHRYLRAVKADMPVDLFDFHPNTHCLAEFVLNKCIVGKKDLSHGKENVPVPCVNYYDNTLPEFCSYNTERTPTAGVPLNLDPEFLCGCDCTNDCEDKSKCACWQMTLEGARTIGLEGPNIGYEYKRLPEPLPSGIYECNSRCKCKQTCLNRVAQHPLQLKLQVFKTINRGWGIRALNDIPKGSFLCIYAGNLLTDATANLDGLNEGDEYLAELDYIEVVEQMKEGYEEDIPEQDKQLDKKQSGKKADDSEEEEMSSSTDDEELESRAEKDDDDFRPGFIGLGVTEFNKRLRKRSKLKKEKGDSSNEKDKEGQKTSNGEEDCITISDDEEVRQPSRFTAQAGMGANEFISKYRSVRSHFGKDEACYIMDAKVQGNIGRYLNHSCTPNVFVQNVFVDTHDPRFPWVAFFALSHVRAGTELTWNYNYDVGSVPGKVLYCYCGAPNCRGRLL